MRDNLSALSDKGVDNTDLVFLQGLLDSPAVTSLVKVSLELVNCRIVIIYQNLKK